MASRNCARCSKDLTDAASMEVGVGPICRKLDNVLLATYIPSDVWEAQRLLKHLDRSALPSECDATVKKIEKAIDAGTTKDWRETVKRIEWLLSWLPSGNERGVLVGVAGALGYVGLASMWSGDAASGKATVRFAEDRTVEAYGDRVERVEHGGFLFYKGPRNRGAREATKTIRGRCFHATTKEWSVPASEAEAFKKLIVTHYPNFLVEGVCDPDNIDELVRIANRAAEDSPKSAPAKPEVKITVVGKWLIVKSPYNADFVSAVKSLPWQARKFSPAMKCWEVDAEYQGFVRDAIERCYGVKLAA
jgi:Family of unknown function (DUF6011)